VYSWPPVTRTFFRLAMSSTTTVPCFTRVRVLEQWSSVSQYVPVTLAEL